MWSIAVPLNGSGTHTDSRIASEKVFLEGLRREVRRTERSGRPFVLALIADDSDGETGPGNAIRSVAAEVAASIRETDSLGWYEQDETLGVVLTEIGELGDKKLTLLAQKISDVIQRATVNTEYTGLRLLIRSFPQRSHKEKEEGWEGEIYRDLHRRESSVAPDKVLKRGVDIVGSLCALLVLLPVFAAIAVLVKLTSRGPVFYAQERVGQYGALFTFYKFRSMHWNSDAAIHREYVAQLIEGTPHAQQSNGMYKLENDPRVTWIGRFLRRSSLDEIPQFLNVIRGDMSLVGPRPPLPYEFDRYRAWHRRRVLEIKPGLTGLWQVKGRSRTTFDEMVRMDLHYAMNRSFWMDLKIIFLTPAAMISGMGAS